MGNQKIWWVMQGLNLRPLPSATRVHGHLSCPPAAGTAAVFATAPLLVATDAALSLNLAAWRGQFVQSGQRARHDGPKVVSVASQWRRWQVHASIEGALRQPQPKYRGPAAPAVVVTAARNQAHPHHPRDSDQVRSSATATPYLQGRRMPRPRSDEVSGWRHPLRLGEVTFSGV